MPHSRQTQSQHGRRRPRPFSCGAVGTTDTGNPGQTLSLAENDKIDTILEQRQREGPPRLEGADARATYGGTSGPDDDDAEGDGGSTVVEDDAASPRTAARRAKDIPPMTSDELAEAHADVFGRPPPGVARTEERLMALEIEVEKLPKAERWALNNAMRKHPLLFVNCPHTKMMLEQDEEDFDAALAARRLAKYWECRRSLFGDSECYAPGVFTKPVFADYRRYYERTLAILDDPRMEEMARQDAERMLRVIHKRKIEALDEVLEEIEEASQGASNLDENDVSVAAEATLEVSARKMARDTSDESKLQFLQAENMNEVKAAQRLIRYWVAGLQLFGMELMCNKRVILDDIKDCSEQLFRCNQVRLMPEEDAFGRSIIVWRQIVSADDPTDGGDGSGDLLSEDEMDRLGITEDHYAKVVWYIMHAALERESCQRNGIVLISDFRVTDGNFKKRGRHRQAITNIANCVPAKIRAAHFLFGPDFPWWQRQVLRGMTYVIGISLRRRLVVHGATMEQNLARLDEEFGIGAEKLPTDLGGTVNTEYFTRWLEERKASGH